MNDNIFDKLDFGPLRSLLDDDDITDISYDNNGQIWIRSLTKGSLRVEIEGATPDFVEKLAFQCSNVMGTTFNNAKPFLDAESTELRMNFVHKSIATNGIAMVIRKTPAKIRLEKEKLIKEDYFTPAIHDLLIKCVEGHCNIIVSGETGSGKTEFVKYLASHTLTNEKIITIEDTLELHLDRIYPQRDIVAMKTNNVASYTDVLVTCMRQNPKWILLSEVRSAEAVTAVRNSISSGHNILSTIHADKASAIPYRLYSLMETDLDVHQFLATIYRYIQLGVHIRAFYSKEHDGFHREVDEVTEFYVDENNEPVHRIIYQKQFGKTYMCKPSKHLIEYIENQHMSIQDIIKDLPDELPITEVKNDEVVEDNFDNNVEDNNNVNIDTKEVKNENNDNPVEVQVPSNMVPSNKEKNTEKKEEENTFVPGADLGHEESIPEITSEGDVPLSEPAVLSLNNVDNDSVTAVVGTPTQTALGATPVPIDSIGDNTGGMVPPTADLNAVANGEVASPAIPGGSDAPIDTMAPPVENLAPVDNGALNPMVPAIGSVAAPVGGTTSVDTVAPPVENSAPVDNSAVNPMVPAIGSVAAPVGGTTSVDTMAPPVENLTPADVPSPAIPAIGQSSGDVGASSNAQGGGEAPLPASGAPTTSGPVVPNIVSLD